jgi:ribonuclease HII
VSRADRRPDLSRELALLRSGCRAVAGLDEAGRGALAGPVVAAVVVLPLERFDLARQLAEVRDSKQLTARQRERCAEAVLAVAVSAAIGQSEAAEVDRLGLLPATRAAMARALAQLQVRPEHLLIDHLRLPEVPVDQSPVTRGDALVLSIAAASVLAKVARDRLLVELDRLYPGYGLARHKGYGTAEHRAALGRLGPSPIHRRSYAPVAAVGRGAGPEAAPQATAGALRRAPRRRRLAVR